MNVYRLKQVSQEVHNVQQDRSPHDTPRSRGPSDPPEERRQIILDFDELERTGKNGDTVLRHHAGRIYQKLQGRPSGFDAAYMIFVANSAHKIASIQALREAEDITFSDQKVMALQLVQEIAKLDPTDQIADLVSRARSIVDMTKEPENESVGPAI